MHSMLAQNAFHGQWYKSIWSLNKTCIQTTIFKFENWGRRYFSQSELPGNEAGAKMPWIPFGTSTPSNSTLAISSNFLASSTRRNGDLSTAGRRTDDRTIPVCVCESRM